MKIKIFLLPIIMTFFIYTSVFSQDLPPYKVDQTDALQLIIMAHGSEISPGFDSSQIEVSKAEYFHASEIEKMTQPFFVFGNYGGTGLYGVNPWTGDVWDLELCQKIETSLSRKNREKILHTFTLQETKQYKKLASLKPECWN